MIQLSIMPASVKREEYEIAQHEKELAHQRYLAERPRRVEKLIEEYFNYTKSCIEKCEGTSVASVLYEDDLLKWGSTQHEERMEAVEAVKTMLEIAGYQVNNWYEYSPGWQYQSGKIGYLFIKW